MLFMPLWSKDEIAAMMQARLPPEAQLSQEDLDNLEIRIGRFGGVPRWVAAADADHAQMMDRASKQLAIALSTLTSEKIADALNTDSASPDISGMLVHLLPNPNFTLATKRFASDMIEKEIIYRCYSSERANVARMLTVCSGFTSYSQTVGHMSEAL